MQSVTRSLLPHLPVWKQWRHLLRRAQLTPRSEAIREKDLPACFDRFLHLNEKGIPVNGTAVGSNIASAKAPMLISGRTPSAILISGFRLPGVGMAVCRS
jgi:hypothetical protein